MKFKIVYKCGSKFNFFVYKRWKGKVAIVTGASAEIGAAVAKLLVETGVLVVGIARRNERLLDLSKQLDGKPGKFHPFKADITKEEDILEAFKWTTENLGPVHILINNAGVKRNTNLTEGVTEMWRTTFETNVLGLCITTREAIKNMKENNIEGHVIHINSMAGHRVPNIPASNVYPASKFAVTALTETLRQELNEAGSKIKITSISPGAVKTEFREASGLTSNQAVMDLFNKMSHLESDDVADAVLYALSTPPHVQINEIMLMPLGKTIL